MASSNDLNLVVDVIVPAVFVIALFVVNGFVLRLILRKRREYHNFTLQEAAMSDQATTSSAAAANDCAIEMERL
ncbi:uncharacterized protein LOC108596060 [Drosophila busckii]|nr:uncharacterized protein LOC108596060 [Drosophila busckii]